MGLIVEDRVMESTVTTGAGVLTLSGAYAGFKAFSSVCSVGDTCYYTAEGIDAFGVPTGEWEDGIATYSAASQLTRTTVTRSSNANAAVTFSAGTKRVMISANQAYLSHLLRYVSFFFTTAPTASEVLLLFVAVDAFTIPANLVGTQVKVGTNSTGTVALDVQQNGTSIGTISIASTGVVTLTTTTGTAKSVAVGDIIKVVAPVTPDATLANVAATIKGTL